MQRPLSIPPPRAALIGLVAVTLVALAACTSTSSAAPSVAPSAEPSPAEPSAPTASALTVTIEGNVLPTVTAAVGENVTWQNLDAVPHTVTLDDGSFNGSVAAGATVSHAFDAAGTFPYHCNVHPSMTGTITITE